MNLNNEKQIEITTGIYQIINIKTNQIYIGSTTNGFEIRKKRHWKLLRNNKHYNRHLQSSWNIHGENLFKFEILEKIKYENCNIEPFLIAEQKYIEKTDTKILYNIDRKPLIPYDSSRNIMGNRKYDRTKITLIDPNGNEFNNIDNLQLFCKEHNLNDIKIYLLIYGKRISHRGWTLKENIKKEISRGKVFKNTTLIDPNGNEYKDIKNVTQFCKNFSLNPAYIRLLLVGKRLSYKNWKVKELFREKEMRQTKIYNITLVDPNGNEYSNIYNLDKFCKERGLFRTNIKKVIDGKRISHKGWKLKNYK